MRSEYLTIIFTAVFFAFIAPIYWILTEDPTGTTALVMTTLLCGLLGFYLGVVARQIPARPEDRSDGEIADGAGEQGFFPPYSWWLFIIGAGIGAVTVSGWIFEYYRGVHAH